MNIHVVRPDGSWYARPDITLVRDADRFCLPDDCSGALAFRSRCIRIEKAGKAIAPRFASRYFNSWAPAVLFYGLTAGGTPTPYLDRATWVSRDFQPVGEREEAFRQQVVRTLEQLSLHLSLRIGDFLIFEQGDPVVLQRGDHLDNIDIL